MLDYYFERFGWCERQTHSSPPPDLRMVVVIPCHDEPDLAGSLASLHECDRPDGAVEVIVVLNAERLSSVIAQNVRSREEADRWYAALADPWFGLHLIDANDLPPKHAGVGLARKIGMDEAVRRLTEAGTAEEGVIVCYDADCRCDQNLLSEIGAFFAGHPKAPGCSVHFEHPLAGDMEAKVYEAIAQYELHLRYHVEACRWAGHPFAYHTIGSSMAVRTGAYMKQGGMNKRKAGEDFYFLQKIILLGNFGEVNGTRVIPSPRISERVPFGTGRAVGDYCQGDATELASYPLEAFEDLQCLFEWVRRGAGETFVAGDGPLQRFLEASKFTAALEEIRSQTASKKAFQKRFFRWFDAFKVMKYVHFARDEEYGAPPVSEVAGRLLERIVGTPIPGKAVDLLASYRCRQREGAWRSVAV